MNFPNLKKIYNRINERSQQFQIKTAIGICNQIKWKGNRKVRDLMSKFDMDPVNFTLRHHVLKNGILQRTYHKTAM